MLTYVRDTRRLPRQERGNRPVARLERFIRSSGISTPHNSLNLIDEK